MAKAGGRRRGWSRPPRHEPHVFAPDANEPADHRDRKICAICRTVGEPGDVRHTPQTMQPPPAMSRARARDLAALDRARLGERGDDD